LALGLNRNIKSRNLLRAIYFFPNIMSTVALGLLFQAIMNPYDGFLNRVLTGMGVDNPPMWIIDPKMAIWCSIIVAVWAQSGVTMAIFLAGLQSIPLEYYEAAKIDGAGAWQNFKNITWPLLRPSLTINVVLNFTTGLRGFEIVYYLTAGGPGNASHTLMTLAHKYMGDGLFAYSATINLILILLILVLGLPVILGMRKSEVEL
jgi:raffinose/stachyose/melibiose transport system permease protein